MLYKDCVHGLVFVLLWWCCRDVACIVASKVRHLRTGFGRKRDVSVRIGVCGVLGRAVPAYTLQVVAAGTDPFQIGRRHGVALIVHTLPRLEALC